MTSLVNKATLFSFYFLIVKLNVKTKMHNITIFYEIFLSLYRNLSFITTSLL